MDAGGLGAGVRSLPGFPRLFFASFRPQAAPGDQAPLSMGPDGAVPRVAQRPKRSEAVASSSRSLQRFLTESPWDDAGMIGWLQEYLGSRLEHPRWNG